MQRYLAKIGALKLSLQCIQDKALASLRGGFNHTFFLTAVQAATSMLDEDNSDHLFARNWLGVSHERYPAV